MDSQHARPAFSLLAYGNNQTCRLTSGVAHQAKLISVGVRGARLRFGAEAESFLRFGDRCLLDLNCALGGTPVAEIPCTVVWLNGREAGIDFRARFDKSILALHLEIALGPLPREEAA